MTRRLGRIRRYTTTLREKEMMEKAKAYAEPMLPTIHDFIMHKMLELASDGNVHAARLVFDEDHRSQERLKYTIIGRDVRHAVSTLANTVFPKAIARQKKP